MLQIKEDTKLFSNVVSKETSIANPSFRVYYGCASSSVAIPFVWEAKPGTPKHNPDPTQEPDPTRTRYPPLTPPPCYSPLHNNNKIIIKSRAPPPHKISNIFFFLFPRNMLHRRQISSSSSLSSMLSVSGSDSMSDRARGPTRSSLGSLLDLAVNGDEMEEVDNDEEGEIMTSTPKSTLCFGIGCVSRKIRSSDYVLE